MRKIKRMINKVTENRKTIAKGIGIGLAVIGAVSLVYAWFTPVKVVAITDFKPGECEEDEEDEK